MMRRSRTTSRRGLTLVELLLAISITVILGTAVATVLTAAARSMTVSRNTQSAVQRAHALQSRFRAYTDPAMCLLDYRAGEGIALWLEDPNADTRVSLSEVRIFWVHADEGTVTVERADFPADWDVDTLATFDILLSPGADFFAEMQALRALGYTKTETIADGVANAELTWDGLTLREQPRAVVRVTLQIDDDSTQQTIACLGMPNHTEPQ